MMGCGGMCRHCLDGFVDEVSLVVGVDERFEQLGFDPRRRLADRGYRFGGSRQINYTGSGGTFYAVLNLRPFERQAPQCS